MTQNGVLFYLVCDYGVNGQEAIIDSERCDKETIIKSILGGDYEGSLHSVACIDFISKTSGIWTDVSRDFADEILDALDTEPHPDLERFLRCHFPDSVVDAVMARTVHTSGDTRLIYLRCAFVQRCGSRRWHHPVRHREPPMKPRIKVQRR